MLQETSEAKSSDEAIQIGGCPVNRPIGASAQNAENGPRPQESYLIFRSPFRLHFVDI